jgi:Flp pilus assembly protein protease CpaA
MSIALLFAFGVVLALASDRLILRFQRTYADEDDTEAEADANPEDLAAILEEAFERGETETPPPAKSKHVVKQLPWQVEPWATYLRRGFVLGLPLLSAIAGWRFDRVIDAIAVSIFVAGLLICTATDLLRYRVPNAVTYPGTLLALLAALFLAPSVTDLLDATLAALLAGGVFLVMAIITRGGMGLGDVKLAVLIGAVLGLQSAFQALGLGVIIGGLIIVVLFLLRFVSRQQAVPYAPFLAIAAVAVLLTQGPVFAPL